ncbi:DUF6896 domain-containing protein [Burkholderia sp. FL-7-2-10-S1-D7]|uniref:DUF6896 domain-containing protein n=1 Tax=Burkholderia sp. FL-7-2-10-S1-D7 TaxID=1637866 RepID=UPI000A7EB7A9|nr:hypothetical protein [Burkholderia sp. FL-7-2-10-S1-D7]
MPLLAPDEFMATVREYVFLQSALQDEFFRCNSAVQDWKYLTDLPRQGYIRALGKNWTCTRHGLGVRFESDEGVVVDVHNRILDKRIVDAHRISEYIYSICKNINDDVNLYGECEAEINNLKMMGQMELMDAQRKIWRLVM